MANLREQTNHINAKMSDLLKESAKTNRWVIASLLLIVATIVGVKLIPL